MLRGAAISCRLFFLIISGTSTSRTCTFFFIAVDNKASITQTWYRDPAATLRHVPNPLPDGRLLVVEATNVSDDVVQAIRGALRGAQAKVKLELYVDSEVR